MLTRAVFAENFLSFAPPFVNVVSVQIINFRFQRINYQNYWKKMFEEYSKNFLEILLKIFLILLNNKIRVKQINAQILYNYFYKWNLRKRSTKLRRKSIIVELFSFRDFVLIQLAVIFPMRISNLWKKVTNFIIIMRDISLPFYSKI